VVQWQHFGADGIIDNSLLFLLSGFVGGALGSLLSPRISLGFITAAALVVMQFFVNNWSYDFNDAGIMRLLAYILGPTLGFAIIGARRRKRKEVETQFQFEDERS
jgi:pilus assembly protein TadC